MSMLSQDTHRRIAERLHAPLPRWAAISEAWERGERVWWRYGGIDSLVHHEGDNPWRECERSGFNLYLGGDYTCTPNWQNEFLEYRLWTNS